MRQILFIELTADELSYLSRVLIDRKGLGAPVATHMSVVEKLLEHESWVKTARAYNATREILLGEQEAKVTN